MCSTLTVVELPNAAHSRASNAAIGSSDGCVNSTLQPGLCILSSTGSLSALRAPRARPVRRPHVLRSPPAAAHGPCCRSAVEFPCRARDYNLTQIVMLERHSVAAERD